jgi:hypothetical protein
MWEFLIKLWRAILDNLHWLLIQLGWIAKPQEAPKLTTLKAFNTLTSHFENLLEPYNICIREKSFQIGLSWEPSADFQLFFCTKELHPLMMSAIIEIFEPMFVYYKQKYGMTALYLDTRKLPDDHPFWTAQGRIEALENIIDALISCSLVLNGRLGNIIAQISGELPHFTPGKVLRLLKDHFAIFKNEYQSSKTPERKAEILKALIELYEPLRNYEYFKEFIIKKETFRQQWMLNKSRLKPLPDELKDCVIDYLIPSPQA